MNNFNWKKILLKISGESLMGDDAFGINTKVVKSFANQIEEESNDLNKAVTVGAQYYIFESCNFLMLLQYFMKRYFKNFDL